MKDEEFYLVAFVDPLLHDPFIMGIVGNIGSGKSVLVQKIIKMWKFKFDVIVWICPTYSLQEHSLIEDTTGIVVFVAFRFKTSN
jgi:ABC-type glutathione transport system ATPase component